MSNEPSEHSQSKTGDSKKATSLAVVSIIAGLLGTGVGAALQGFFAVRLERQKFESTLIQKALDTTDTNVAAKRLIFLVDSGVIQSLDSGKIKSLAEEKPTQLPIFNAPLVGDARMFLLAGSPEKAKHFIDLRSELAKAGFNVIGDKTIIDPGRPDQAEVRYFNDSDQQQAEDVTSAARGYLKEPTLTAKKYRDESAKPGYIEIWLGR